MNNKEDLMLKVISDLYHMYRYENCHRMDQALCAVLEAMEKYPTQKDIQISGRYLITCNMIFAHLNLLYMLKKFNMRIVYI